MKHAVTFLFLVLAGTPALPAAEAARLVLSAQRRMEVFKVAERVLAARQAGWPGKIADLPDPFFRRNFVRDASATAAAVAEPAPTPQRADLDVLREVAGQIQPDGIFIVGSDRYLLLRGKRVKVGDSLTVTSEGLVYHILISSIEKNVYTLRLNDQELRREFK